VTDATLANLVAYSAQVLIVVAAGALAAALVRLPMARARIVYWRLILAACFALPLLARPADRIVFVAGPRVDVRAASVVVDAEGIDSGPALSAAAAVTWLVLAGAAARAAWLGVGILALVRLRRRSDVAALPDDVEVLRKGVAPAASIRWHAKIAQPVAFGWRRPVVLLPQRVADLPLDAQRAVVCHELLHVARRDWLWMLVEEAIRCLFWFHPAIWFALAKLQLSREELVDEEVVRITGIRQPYIRALAMFAGEPAAYAAMPFIRRRHLLSRIRQLSEEHTMSGFRIACAFAVLLAVIASTGWTAASALPLRVDGTTVLPLPGAVVQTRVPLPAIQPAQRPVAVGPASNQDAAAAQHQELADETAARLKRLAEMAAELQAARQRMVVHIGDQPPSPLSTVTYRVSPVYPEAAKGHGVEAVVTVRVTVGTAGEVTNVEVVRTRLSTERDINDPAFWASQPSRLFGQAAEDAVRVWRFEPPGVVRRFEVPVSFGEHNLVPVSEPLAAQMREVLENRDPARYTTHPIKVQGAIAPPLLVARVAPEYPAAAKAARVEGIVIVGMVIGRDGAIREAWIERSIPLLDEAALAAVRQWKYQPTLLNGEPWEVRMTATVNFTLP
jgi:TonB family protein